MECIIDAHTHLPLQPPTSPQELLRELRREAGIEAAVVLGIPPAREIAERIPYEDVLREYHRSLRVIERYAAPYAEELRPENLYYTVARLLRSYGPLCKYPPRGRGYAILAAVDLSLPPDQLADKLEELIAKGYTGFKVITTLFFTHLDDPRVETVLEVAEAHGAPVVVHAGCDPGIWELPRYCRYGDPSRLEPLLARHRDVQVVIAHIGSYSAIAPGVFTQETVELIRRYPNVYTDTSATLPHILQAAAKIIPPDRLLFGTDHPVTDTTPRQQLAVVQRILRQAGYSKGSIERVLCTNAAEVFNIKPYTGSKS